MLYVIVGAENLREEKMKEEIEQQINNEDRPRKVELKGTMSWTETAGKKLYNRQKLYERHNSGCRTECCY